MKVLHVIESLEIGGAERVVVDLANAQIPEMGVGVCCVKTEGALSSSLDSRVLVHCLDKGEGNDWRLPERIGALVRSHGYDVVHSHGWGVFLESAFIRNRVKLRRLVHTVHGKYLNYQSGPIRSLKRIGRRLLERRVVRMYDAVVTVSDAARDYVASHLQIGDSKLITIHNGIRSTTKISVTHSGPTLVFITAGRLAEVKNQSLMLRAFARFTQEWPAAELRILGDGPCRQTLVAEARALAISDRVQFLGFSQNVEDELARAHVFLLTSHYEGISISVLEAMRARLPVIATRVGGVGETVKDMVSGILIADDDEDALVAAMRRLAFAKDERISLGMSGLALLREEFSIEKTVHKYVELYRSGVIGGIEK